MSVLLCTASGRLSLTCRAHPLDAIRQRACCLSRIFWLEKWMCFSKIMKKISRKWKCACSWLISWQMVWVYVQAYVHECVRVCVHLNVFVCCKIIYKTNNPRAVKSENIQKTITKRTHTQKHIGDILLGVWSSIKVFVWLLLFSFFF